MQKLRNGTQGLGWFLRRTVNPIAAAPFYIQGLGLPKLRSWEFPEEAGVMLWAGDVSTLELNGISKEVAFDPDDSTCIPIFRSASLAESGKRALAYGAKLVSEAEDMRAIWQLFIDPEGFGFGIEEVKQPVYETDNYHDQLWRRGSVALPGGITIDGPIEGISRILHYANDVASEVVFLEKMGFRKVNENAISLGGGCIVQVEQREVLRDPIADRTQSFDTWIARVYGLEEFAKALLSAGGRSVSRHTFKGGTLDYAMTPGNALFGWQERNPYNPDLPTTQMVEDLYSRSLWLEGQE